MLIECTTCYEEFTQRKGTPNYKVCPKCVPDVKEAEDYRCPKCGWDATTDDCYDHKEVVGAKYNYWAAMQYGGNPEDWTEKCTCPECETKFEFENGSY